MNGIHDLGGMDGFGPVRPEADEPVFHEPWEGRVYAMVRATAFLGRWNLDGTRFSHEKMPPADYLAASYYERWLYGLEQRLLETGLVTADELAGRTPPEGRAASPSLTRDMVPRVVGRRGTARRADGKPGRFAPGDAVVARVMSPPGHTRIPRYVRGRRGVVARDYGVYVLPDTNAVLAGENAQHVYSVRFAAREVWGADAAAQDEIYLDLWDQYLDPA